MTVNQTTSVQSHNSTQLCGQLEALIESLATTGLPSNTDIDLMYGVLARLENKIRKEQHQRRLQNLATSQS